MTHTEKEAFLQSGGMLIRRTNAHNGEPIIKKRTATHRWKPVKSFGKFPNNQVRDQFFNVMLKELNAQED